jgi:hypothetical protein
MRHKPVKIEIEEVCEGRFIVRTYADGTVEREPVVRLPRRKRYPPRPYWEWTFDRKEE